MDSNGGKHQHALQVLGILGIGVLAAALTSLLATAIDRAGLPPGDLATWVGAIGGVVAAVATVGTLVWAVRSTLHESRENRRLAREVEADKRAAEAERIKAHAQQIYAWSLVNSKPPIVFVGNSSQEPVTGLVLYLVWAQGAAYHTGEEAERQAVEPGRIRGVVQTLPPGRYSLELPGADNTPRNGQIGVEIAFTDRGGRHWVRRATGELTEMSESPLDHYGIPRPIEYSFVLPQD